MERILLLGVGQLGRALSGVLPLYGDTTIWGRGIADLAQPEKLPAKLDDLKPDFIFNAAAYTRVEQAELFPDLAQAVNGQAPAAIAAWAKANGATLVHYSTDYVFDGAKDGPYDEDDAPRPLNAYGRSKLWGDEAVMKVGGAHFIFRTSWVYGLGGQNFPSTVLNLAKSRDFLDVVDSQVGAPTSAEFLALASSLAAFQPRKPYGLYNLTASGSVSWRQLAQYLIEKALSLGEKLLLTPENVRPVASLDDYRAKRPANSLLSNAKFRKTFGIRSPDWPYYMDLYLEAILGRRGISGE
jgi:dTDP-4-dehydrorhamnose reductase